MHLKSRSYCQKCILQISSKSREHRREKNLKMGASDPLPEVIVLQKVKITIADRIQLQTRKDTVRGVV